MQNMKGEISGSDYLWIIQAGVTDRGWIPAGNSHPYQAGLGFGSGPKAGRSEQQAEEKKK